MIGGLRPEELASYKYVVYTNCLSQMKILVGAVKNLNQRFEKNENNVRFPIMVES
jgi:hypothetical protein